MSSTLTPAPVEQTEAAEQPHRVKSGLLDPKLIVASSRTRARSSTRGS